MKFLVIKTGEYETFDQETRLPIVSLGDVLRSTVLIHALQDCTWYSSLESERLLAGQKVTQKLNYHDFDVVVNLENNEELISKLGHNSVGFIAKNRLRLMNGEEMTFSEFLNLNANLNWPQKLFKLVGKEWKNERPVLHTREVLKENHLGLNWKVGPKWPAKDWGKKNWKEVYARMIGQFGVSWQEGFDDLDAYIKWIQSVKVLLTHDSLGLHIAQALKIPVVALFGPTSSKEIPLYEEDIFLNFHQDPHLTPARIEEILKQVILRSKNESSIRWK